MRRNQKIDKSWSKHCATHALLSPHVLVKNSAEAGLIRYPHLAVAATLHIFGAIMVYGLEWLTGSPQPKVEPVRAKSGDGGYVAPDRSARERCYESRDIFFACLDQQDILDANKHDAESRQKCPEEVAAYERDCAKSWVGHGLLGCGPQNGSVG
jgi:hypothetical protein